MPITSLTLRRRIAYVSDPSTNRIPVIHLDDAEIEEVFTVEITDLDRDEPSPIAPNGPNLKSPV
ncbi:MAG: hypothetical protein EA426_19195, partial [Spirochaetaceae bacterium]